MRPALLRRILLAAGLLIGGAALATAVASFLLLGTTTGARWALSWASGSLPFGSLTVREVRGMLASPLELRGVAWRTKSLEVSVDRLAAGWDLSDLLQGALEVRTLHADGVRVRQLAPSPPTGTTQPPALPDLRLPLALRVGELRVRDFRYVPRGDSGAFVFDEVRAAGELRGELVRISSLRVRSRLFDVEAHGQVRPRREYPLDVELGWVLRLPGRPEFRGRGRVAGSVERARVSMRVDAPCEASADAELSQLLSEPRVDGRLEFSRLDPRGLVAGAPRMRLSGWIAARGTAGRFQARGRLSMRSGPLGAVDATGALARLGDSLRVDRLLVTVPGRAERANVRGLLTGLGRGPRADLVVDWQGLVWPLRGDTLLSSDRGRLRLAGTPARYALRLDGGLAIPGTDLGRWQAEATGDTAHLEVASLQGWLSGGAVLGSGTVAWKPRLRWRATLRGDNLDPGRHWQEWPGRLALELETEGEVRDTALRFEARITRLEGTLRRLPLTGRGILAVSGRSRSARDLRLSWGEARLTADGTAGESWDFDASLTAPSLGPFLEGASGAVRAGLRLTGPRDDPRVQLDASGDSLVVGQLRAGALAIMMDAGLHEGDTLRLDLDARKALLGGLPLDTLTLRVAGSTSCHTLSAWASAAGDTLSIAASGGLARESWRGSFDRFELRTRGTGVWRLEAPVAVAASAREVRVDSFCVGSGAGSVRGAAGWDAGGAFHAMATLAALPMGLLDPWLTAGAHLHGTFDGSLEASAERPEGPLTASVRLTQAPAQIIYSITATERDTVHLGESRLTLDSDAQGARGALAIQWESGNHLDVQVVLPGFNVLRPDTMNQSIEGRLRSQASDLAVLGAYIPGLDHTRGELSADLELAGTLSRPETNGEILLRAGSASIPELGVSLQDVNLAARCEPGRRIALEGSVRSGKGSVAITGAAELARMGWPRITFGVKGKDFTVADTRVASVNVSPDIQVELQRSRVDVSGQVDVPFARLVTLDRLEQLPVPPSSDVVFVGREEDSTRAGPRVFSRVRVVIGDDVEVRVPGFRGKPEGSILAIDEPGQTTRATGELKVREGVYRAYGQDLHIERGRLIFGGGSISNPGLDLRASRTASDGTVAGFQITGTAQSPVLTLFSTPAMSQNDALSYIMFGKPLSETGGSGAAAIQTASQLSVHGTDRLARGVAGKLGVQDASVESKEGSLQEASLFLGTYLSPKLYVSYGIGLFNSETTIRMRYRMGRHWSVQTESGSAPSGVVQFTGER